MLKRHPLSLCLDLKCKGTHTLFLCDRQQDPVAASQSPWDSRGERIIQRYMIGLLGTDINRADEDSVESVYDDK